MADTTPRLPTTVDANGIYTIQGSGADIWGTADSFEYAYAPVKGDGSIIARVAALANSIAWAKAGIMHRNDETAGSAFADVVITPGSGVGFQWRASAGASQVVPLC